MFKKQIIFMCLWFCMLHSAAIFHNGEQLLTTTTNNKQQQQHEKLLQKHKKTIDRYQDDKHLEQLVEQVEDISQRYANDQYIYNLTHAEELKKEKIIAFNNQLIYEIPYPTILQGKIPRIGIHNKDVIKACIMGAQWSVEWYFKKELEQFFTAHIFQNLVQHADDLIALGKQCQDDASNNPNINKQIKLYSELTTIAHKQLTLDFKNILNGHLARILLSNFLMDEVLESTKHTFLIDKIDNAPKLHNILFKSVDKKQSYPTNKPIPIFSFIEEHVLMQLVINNPKAGLIEWVNNGFSYWGLLPHFYESRWFSLTKNLALHLLFTAWFTHYFLKPFWSNYLFNNFSQLISILKEYKKDQSKNDHHSENQIDNRQNEPGAHDVPSFEHHLTDFIQRGLHVSFMTWIKIKHTKRAEWKMYSNVIMSLPGWYRLFRGAYNLYKEATKQPEALTQEGTSS